jgi:hypothetical protein
MDATNAPTAAGPDLVGRCTSCGSPAGLSRAPSAILAIQVKCTNCGTLVEVSRPSAEPVYRKTTELRGVLVGYQQRHVATSENVLDGASIVSLVPDEARWSPHSNVETGPRGTFRITVEFTPDPGS